MNNSLRRLFRDFLSFFYAADGGWGAWKSWSGCSKSCDSGSKERTRDCNNPPPKGDGSSCDGHAKQETRCNQTLCPGTS